MQTVPTLYLFAMLKKVPLSSFLHANNNLRRRGGSINIRNSSGDDNYSVVRRTCGERYKTQRALLQSLKKRQEWAAKLWSDGSLERARV